MIRFARVQLILGIVVAMCGVTQSQKIATPPSHPTPPFTPQEVLLLFAGDTAQERILLTLNNNRTSALTTTMTAYTADGSAVPLPDVSMVANESKQVELSAVLKAAGLGTAELAWLKLDYSGFIAEMGAQLTLYPNGADSGIDSPRSLASDFKSTERHAVFWMPKKGAAKLSLTNASSGSLFVKLSCGPLVEDIVVPALETKVRHFSAPQLSEETDQRGSPVACDMVSDGAVSALRPVGTITSPGGYSAPMRFYDATTATFQSLTAVGLETSAETLVTVHNLTDYPVHIVPILREATLAAPYTSKLPLRTLKPHEAVQVDIADLLSDLRKENAPLATLTLETASPKGSIVGAVTQIGDPNRLVEDIPLRTSNPPAFARGSYPLRWDQDYTNMVTVTNTADSVLNIGGAITAGDVVYVLKREPIQPGSTMVWDVDKMKREKIPDVNGKILPKDAAFGKIHWIELANGKYAGLLGRTSLSSVRNRRKSSFSCYNACYYAYSQAPLFDQSPFPVLTIGGSQTVAVTQYYAPVYGPSYTYPAGYDGWLSANTSGIINLSFSQNYPLDGGGTESALVESAVGVGSTTMQYSFTEDDFYTVEETSSCEDQNTTTQETGTGDVPCATPNNFSSPAPQMLSDGTMSFQYTFGSTTGNTADLSACTVGETVFYQDNTNPYVWPLPMVYSGPNPLVLYSTVSGGTGSTALLLDVNRPPNSFQKPYFANNFDATQRLQWKCPCSNGGAFTRFVPDITISRRVFQDTDGKWKYSITKSGYTNTIVLP